MANETTIPMLPCRSIDEMLTFYVALGFEVTYHQTRPNTYACSNTRISNCISSQ